MKSYITVPELLTCIIYTPPPPTKDLSTPLEISYPSCIEITLRYINKPIAQVNEHLNYPCTDTDEETWCHSKNGNIALRFNIMPALVAHRPSFVTVVMKHYRKAAIHFQHYISGWWMNYVYVLSRKYTENSLGRYRSSLSRWFIDRDPAKHVSMPFRSARSRYVNFAIIYTDLRYLKAKPKARFLRSEFPP